MSLNNRKFILREKRSFLVDVLREFLNRMGFLYENNR